MYFAEAPWGREHGPFGTGGVDSLPSLSPDGVVPHVLIPFMFLFMSSLVVLVRFFHGHYSAQQKNARPKSGIQ